MRAARRLAGAAATGVLAVGVWLVVRAGQSARFGREAPPAAANHPALFDPAKVRAGNLPSPAGAWQSAVAIWTEAQPVELNSYLRADIASDSVTWQAGGAAVANGRLNGGSRPRDNHVHSVTIVARTAAGADAFVLVIVPPSTARAFAEWLPRERAATGWIEALPPVYARLGPNYSNPEPETCKPRVWPTLRKIDTYYHPGAAYEMRSAVRPDGSGHQATYSAVGELLRTGAAAGSADRGSPTKNPLQLLRHARADVIPYIWAAQLDGNPVNPALLYNNFDRPLIRQGEHIAEYLEVRPTYGPSRRELQPGQCIDAAAR
jgi:hypothetical protein